MATWIVPRGPYKHFDDEPRAEARHPGERHQEDAPDVAYQALDLALVVALGNGPNNFAVLRHMALNIIKADSSKGSNRGKFKRAGWNDNFLAKLLAQV